MNALNIRSAADFRAFLYVLLPLVSALAVGYGYVDESQAALWTGLATAVLGPVIAFVNSRDVSTFRAAFYAVFGAVQLIAIGYGLVTDAQVGVWLPLVSAFVGVSTGGVAAANTDTTPSGEVVSVRDTELP